MIDGALQNFVDQLLQLAGVEQGKGDTDPGQLGITHLPEGTGRGGPAHSIVERPEIPDVWILLEDVPDKVHGNRVMVHCEPNINKLKTGQMISV